MITIESYFWILGVLAFLSAAYGIKRYHTPLNPITIFSIYNIGGFVILSGVVCVNMFPSIAYGDEDIVKTILISIVFLFGVTLPYLFHGSLLSNLFGKGLDLLGLNSESVAIQFNSMKFALLLVGAACAFIALALVGGGDMLWITDSRAAYVSYRAGAGPFFALTQWLLTFAMLYYIWTTKPRTLKMVPILLFFCGTMYFLGSKNNILTLLVISVAYHNFYIKRIPFLIFVIFVPLFVLAILSLLVLGGSFSSLPEATLYFRDYFDTTTQFISRFNEFGFRYGAAWQSSFWFYVPRGLFADKPYEYGETLIHQVLFPGAAASGNTPGLLQWSLAYLDFGVVGVFFNGLFIGIWQRMSYEYFLEHRREFFAFILAMHFSIWPVWTFAPLVIVIFLSIGQSISLKFSMFLKIRQI